MEWLIIVCLVMFSLLMIAVNADYLGQIKRLEKIVKNYNNPPRGSSFID